MIAVEKENSTRPSNPVEKKNQPRISNPDDAAKGALRDWVSAQNESKFEKYANFYAKKFNGVKRARGRLYRFTQQAWLRDRKKMFRKPFSVEISKVDVRQKTSSVFDIEFIQKWTSKTFSDVGRKRIILFYRDGEAKILREEMLTSSSSPGSTKLSNFAFVYAGSHVIVDDLPEDAFGGSMIASNVGGAWIEISRELKPKARKHYESILRRPAYAFSKHERCSVTFGPPQLMWMESPHSVYFEEFEMKFADVVAAKKSWDAEEHPPVVVAARVETRCSDPEYILFEDKGVPRPLLLDSEESFTSDDGTSDGEVEVLTEKVLKLARQSSGFKSVPFDEETVDQVNRWKNGDEEVFEVTRTKGEGCDSDFVSLLFERRGSKFVEIENGGSHQPIRGLISVGERKDRIYLRLVADEYGAELSSPSSSVKSADWNNDECNC